MPRHWILHLVLLLGPTLTFGETAELPELKSNHHDLSDPAYFGDDEGKKGSVGKDIEKFGEEVAGRLDRLVSRKGFRFLGDPWTIQGIPLMFPSSDTGFNLGVNAALANIRREDPHQAEVTLQALASDRGRYKHFFRLDLPHFLDDTYHLTFRVNYNRDINFRYFGIGNETPADRKLINEDTILYQNIRNGPSMTISFLKRFGQYFSFGPTLGMKWTKVEFPTGSLLDSQRPDGSAGGRTHYLGLAAVYNNLDFLPNPRRGTYHELFFNWYMPALGSDYHFARSTYTFRHYWPLHKRVTLAHRTMFESLSGTVPFYEMGATGGTDSSIGFGGDRFMRGFQSNRFIDHIKMALGLELRWDLTVVHFAKQQLAIGFVPYVDIGRVWDKLLPVQIGKLHASTGWGTRIVWNDRFILRADLALTQEGTAVYVELGQSF